MCLLLENEPLLIRLAILRTDTKLIFVIPKD
jgi:hypothetical protein